MPIGSNVCAGTGESKLGDAVVNRMGESVVGSLVGVIVWSRFGGLFVSET